MLDLTEKCTSTNRDDRPTMTQVVQQLQTILQEFKDRDFLIQKLY